MILFVCIAAAMLVAALAWVLVPLLRGSRGGNVRREASNVAILRDQLAELETDLANGTLQREQYDQARRELEARVLEESRATHPEKLATGPTHVGAYTAAILGAAIPIGAAVLYFALGGYQAFAPGAMAAASPNSNGAQHDLSPEKVAEMAASLAARLEREPGNAEGWSTLAHTYYSLQRFPEAVAAYERAEKLVPDNADLLADYADALGAANRSLAGKPTELVNRALKADPKQWKALALAGTIAFDRKDYRQAVTYWEQLKGLLPPESDMARSIESSIAEARDLGKITTAAVPERAAGTPAKAAEPAIGAAPKAGAGATAPVPGSSLSGEVRLSPALAKSVGPDAAVFVIARAAEGPKMPLAIVRKQVRDLPFKFALDDSLAMAPDMKVSNFAQLVVTARVSRTGNAMPTSGDLEGSSAPVKLGTQGIQVVIDSTRP